MIGFSYLLKLAKCAKSGIAEIGIGSIAYIKLTFRIF